jgi:hypothetical protein
MRKICLVSCVSSKRPSSAPAEDLYTSALFQKASAYAKSRFDEWYILSAKYGLLAPSQLVAPYEQTLNNMPKKARLEWADSVFKAVLSSIEPHAILAFVAGERYREDLLSRLAEEGYIAAVPLEGLSIGMQLSWLKKLHDEGERLRHLDEFYALLQTLEAGCGGRRILRECTGQLEWPKMGVYFFFQPGEYRTSDVGQDRVVRVGTHTVSKGSKSTLWGRLRTHRGGVDGSGNHRGSVFRLHVGTALINQSRGKIATHTWGTGQTATGEIRVAEYDLERKVSEYIGAMSLLWLDIQDEPGPASDRAFIEQNAIALLSGTSGPIDLPRPAWLGRYNTRDAIRRSGLWNVNYVDDDYDPRFLKAMAAYVESTLGRTPAPKISIAPPRWAAGKRRGLLSKQTSLFTAE